MQAGGLRWLEISGDFQCNNRCLGCFTLDGAAAPGMSTAEVIDNLRRGRAAGASWLWLGGGEPTLRKDLFTVARAARGLGYERIKLQTNGLLLAYPDYVRRCVDAGISEVNFAIKGAVAGTHDRYTRTPGSFELLLRGLEAWRAHGLPADGDVLVYRGNVAELPALVAGFAARGVERFNLWLLSAADRAGPEVTAEMPRIADLVPALRAAAGLGLSDRSDFLTSLHTPPCTLPIELSRCQFLAADLALLVANPGGYRFRLEDSPIEGGAYLDRCDCCALRSRCGGIRREYLALHGDAEFQPVAADAPHRVLPMLRDVVGPELSRAAQ